MSDMFEHVDNADQIDQVAERLSALVLAENLLGSPDRANIVSIMLELYLVGRIDVTFDEGGEPTATLSDLPDPLMVTPLFVAPTLVPPTEGEKRPIGFKPVN